MFPAALASDITYLNSAEIQWTNFSAWLITGGLLGGGFALIWNIVALLRRKGSARSLSLSMQPFSSTAVPASSRICVPEITSRSTG